MLQGIAATYAKKWNTINLTALKKTPLEVEFAQINEDTDGFTDDELMEIYAENFDLAYDKLEKSFPECLKASAGSAKPQRKTLTDKQKAAAGKVKKKGQGVKAKARSRSANSGKSFTDRMNRAKAAKAKESSEVPAQSTNKNKAKTAKKTRTPKEPKAKAEKAPKAPNKKTAEYLAAIKSKSLPFEVGLIRTFINLVSSSTKEKIVEALTQFKKSYHAGKWNKNSVFLPELRAIQTDYLAVLNAGKAPYTLHVDGDRLAKLVKIVGGEKIYRSVALLNKFVGWTSTAKNEKQIHALLSETRNAVKSGKIDPNDPYADKIGEIIHVLERAKAGQPFKAEATALNGLAGRLGCSCHKPVRRKAKPAKKRAKATSLSGLGDTEPDDAPAVTPEPAPAMFPGVITSAQVETVDYPKYTFAPPWGALFGEPQTNATVMVWGLSGQGKSTFAFKFARYLATAHGPVLYVSSEEIRDGMPSFTIKKKLDMVGGSVSGWDFAGDLSKLTARHKFLFVDSVNTSRMTRDELTQIKKQHPDLFVVLIFQATKAGQFKGENDWSHDVDVVLEVGAGEAKTTKNRFAELTTINIF